MFITMWSEIEGRIDAKAYCLERKLAIKTLESINYKKEQLRKICSFISKRTNILDKTKRYIGLDSIESNTNDIDNNNNICDINGTSSIVSTGDILFSKLRPYLNKVTIAKEDGYCSTELVVLKNKSTLLTEYIMIFLSSTIVLNQTKYITTGHTLPRLQMEDIRKLRIPIPNTKTQRLIVNTYKDAKKLKEQYLFSSSEELESIDTYLLQELGIVLPEMDNSYSARVFTTTSKEVTGNRVDGFYNKPELNSFEKSIKVLTDKKLIDVLRGFSGVVYKRDDEREEGHAILRANNINVETNELDLSDIRYIDEEIQIKDSQKLCKNDIFMCSASGSKTHAGKVAFIEEDTDFYFGGFMMALRAKYGVNARYMFEYMCSSIYKKLLYRRLGGTNINNVNYELIKDIPVILPDETKQAIIVEAILNKRKRAKELIKQANDTLIQAKEQIEKIILGE